jgi:predicted transcriptional regulator
MTTSDAESLRDTVVRRHDILDHVDAAGVRKRDLVDRVGVSRSTVDRGVRELEEAGLVERRDGRVHRTLAGSVALNVHDRMMRRLAGVGRAGRLLATLPADAPLDPAVLEDADVVLSDTTTQYRPMSSLDNLIRRSDQVHVCAQGLCAPQVETFRDSVVESGLVATVVVTDEVLDRLVADFTDVVLEVLRTGRVDLFRTDERVPYSVLVGEHDDGEEMGLGVYTTVGMAGYASNDSAEAVAWARDRIDDHVAAATPIDTGDV